MLSHSILSSSQLKDTDEKKIKRVIPKASNKIIDQTVARLYIAYPNPTVWQYTGLSGAVVLVDDLVGKSFYLKLVDIEGQRGVLWDQELYIDFKYYQDRTFFHSFELEDCLAGLLFEDRNEAAHFFKRVTQRQKYGSKETVNNKAATPRRTEAVGGAGTRQNGASVGAPPPPPTTQGPKAPLARAGGTLGPRGDMSGSHRRRGQLSSQTYYDDEPPVEWRALYTNLAQMGITEDMIAANTQFIKDFIQKQGGPLVGLEPPLPRKFAPKSDSSSTPGHHSSESSTSTRAPPPPPPPPPVSASQQSFGAPPPPPQVAPHASDADGLVAEEKSHHRIGGFLKGLGSHVTRGSHQHGGASGESPSYTAHQGAPSESHSPAPPVPSGAAPSRPHTHSVPPPLPSSNTALPPQETLPNNPTSSSPPPTYATSSPVPPAPDTSSVSSVPAPVRRKVPPAHPSLGNRANTGAPPPSRPDVTQPSVSEPPVILSRSGALPPMPPRTGAPPPTPSRAGAPPPTPSRSGAPPPTPSRSGAPPPTPSRSGAPPPTPSRSGAPPPTPSRDGAPPPPTSSRPGGPPLPPPVRKAVPAPPPRAPASVPPTAVPQSQPAYDRPPVETPHAVSIPVAPPAPPALFGSSAPLAPPPPPTFAPPPAAHSDNDQRGPAPAVMSNDLLSSITTAGIGSLKKVDKSHLERPTALLQSAKGVEPSGKSNHDAAAPPGGAGDLAGALAAALSARKSKVTASDEEEAADDDWD